MIIILFILFEIGLFGLHPEIAMKSLKNSFEFSGEILTTLPPVFVLIGLIDSWLPKSFIESHLGAKSGLRGMLMASLMGSIAVGPLFSAFPMAFSLQKKGSRIANVVIFLGSWATIKLPMILMESHFLGFRFSIIRTAVTVPFVLLCGVLVEKFIAPNSRQFERPQPNTGQ